MRRDRHRDRDRARCGRRGRRARAPTPVGEPCSVDRDAVEGDRERTRVELGEAAVPRRRAGGGEHTPPVRVAPEGGRLDEWRGGDAPRDRPPPARRPERPATSISSTTVAPSPSATICRARSPHTSSSAAAKRASLARSRDAGPLAPLASSTTASFVEHSPSTEMRLNVRSTAGRRNASASSGSSG